MNKGVFAFALAAAVALAGGAAWAGICDEEVATAEGKVLGQRAKGFDACEYKGIPYAADPVDGLRWKPPQPAPARSETLKAREFGHRCVAGGSGSGAPKSMLPDPGEDCLNLNVWRPAKSGAFPVMVWIHGGSLTTGTGAEPIYWGDRLAAEKDVVVVSINYRLNYFGFLAHPALTAEDENHSSGNYGLMDQIAALKWVRANIAGFGGDAANVTIFGESAGGWSVCNLMASPLAAGAFDKAILESGGCDVTKSLASGEEDGAAVAEALGCTGGDVLACLRGKTVKDIGKAVRKVERKEKGKGLAAEFRFKWVPKVDNYVLAQTPVEALRSGEFNKVPLMVGSNRDEAKLFALAEPGLRLAPPCLVEKLYGDMFKPEVAAKVLQLYPFANYHRPADAAMDALGDMALGCKCWDAAEAVSDHTAVYYYRFDYDKHLAPKMIGAAHGFEIPFVFGNLDRVPASWVITRCEQEDAEKLSQVMMAYWTNFAKTGDPNAAGLPEWPPYKKDDRRRMFFNLESAAAPTDNVEKCEFWDVNALPMTEE